MMAFGAAARPKPRFVPQTDSKPRHRIAFVCVGNAARSQMAEAWARHLARTKGVEVEAMSAGMTPLGIITPETYQVMEEKKVSLEGQESKGREAIDWEEVDLLVNLTGLPWRSVVPGFRGAVQQWDVRDPYGEPIATYRKIRDQLERRVKRLLAELKKSSAGGPPAPVA